MDAEDNSPLAGDLVQGSLILKIFRRIIYFREIANHSLLC